MVKIPTLLSVFLIHSVGVCLSYYASTTGNDGGNGTTQAPYRTIGKAASVAGPGDTVIVKAGTYAEALMVRRSGTASAWIVIRSESRFGAVIDPRSLPGADNFGMDAINLDSVCYVEISGFELSSGKNSSGVGADYGHHTRIFNCDIHDCGASGIQLNHGDYRHIEGNTVSRCAFYMGYAGSGISMWQAVAFDNASGPHNIVRSNICHSNDNLPGTALTDGNGIIIDDFRNTQNSSAHPAYTPQTLVENNLCHSNGAKGIHVFFSDNVIVRNNTCYLNNRRIDDAWWRGELCAVVCSNVQYVNNIAVTSSAIQEHNAAILIGNTGSSMSNVIWRNNLTYDIANTPGISVFYDGASTEMPSAANGNKLAVNPQLAGPSAGNYRLMSNSPCVNSGTGAYGLSATDLDGHARIAGSAVDMGAYESQTATASMPWLYREARARQEAFKPCMVLVGISRIRQMNACLSGRHLSELSR